MKKTITRRDFLKTSTILGAAITVSPSFAINSRAVFAQGAPVIWLQGQSCTGCSVSLLNTIYFQDITSLLSTAIDLKYHNTLMAGAGSIAVTALQQAVSQPGYILVIEGAIPSGSSGLYSEVYPGMTMLQAVKSWSPNAKYIIAAGTCASFGGMSSGAPNPTAAKGVYDLLSTQRSKMVTIPGCPLNPDWLVGSIAYILKYGALPAVDTYRRPSTYYGKTVHQQCPNRGGSSAASQFSQAGCLKKLGCKGNLTSSDCPLRKWNSGAAGQYGVNWCIGSRNPCLGCTQPGFPDTMSPFYKQVFF